MITPESTESLARRIRVARGLEPADTLFVNGKVACTFTGELLDLPVAVAEGRVVALGGAHGARGGGGPEGGLSSPRPSRTRTSTWNPPCSPPRASPRRWCPAGPAPP